MTDTEPEAPTRQVNVTCHTDGCGNAEISIPLVVADDGNEPAVVCGVCSQQISDIT